MELTVTLEPSEMTGEFRLRLFGVGDRNLKLLRDTLDVHIYSRENQIRISGPAAKAAAAAAVLRRLQRTIRHNGHVNEAFVAECISQSVQHDDSDTPDVLDVFLQGRIIKPRTEGQKKYVEAMGTNDMIFCLGPAGTGKTYLATAVAAHLLKREKIKRLVLVRPAVEAGEKLGFLPGDLQQKVNPYLRPLLDALHDMMGYEQIKRFMANDMIEIIPLAFMRGRTLNESVIILDEAQNTTVAQMMMFLTRMGNGSKVIVTGDASQVDLPDGTPSGLSDACRRLRGIKGISFITLEKADIVRHNLVQNVVEAYSRDQK